MSDAAAATAAPAKATKKRAGGAAKAKKPADHPKYVDMVKAALGALKERGGSSRHAILKYIVTHYKLGQDERAINAHLKLALRAGVKNGLIKQSKGTGAAGSFKLGEKAEKKVAKKPKAVKKPKAAGSPKKAKKPKKVAASGEAKPKKAKAAKKAKSPAKAKAAKPKTAKKPKVAKSPKKPKTTKAAKPKAAKPKKAPAKK